MVAARPVLVAVLAVVALFAFGPTFVLVTLTSFGALGSTLGNLFLLVDLAAALAALTAAVLAFRRHPAWRAVAVGAGVGGAVAAAAFLVVTWPWVTETEAMVRIALLHAWAPLLALVAWLPRSPRQG